MRQRSNRIAAGRFVAGLAVALFALSLAAGARAEERSIRCATNMPGMPTAKDVIPVQGRALNPQETPYGPPPNPQLGQSWLWWVWNLNGPPTATLKSATVRGVGQNCYVVVLDSSWNAGDMNYNDVATIINRFDSTSVGRWPNQGIWDLDTGTFGPPPDKLDHDPRIYLFYYPFGIAADGFWWVYDEYPDGSQPYHSNECEVVYLDDVQSPPASDYMNAVVAHEFQHMIHWTHDPNEDSWVNEGCSEYAMWMFGHPDGLTAFATNPDNDLTAWSGSTTDYEQSELFFVYLGERFGGRPMLTSVVYDTLEGTAGIDDALAQMGTGQTFKSVFQDWCVANYVNDPTIGDGRYGHPDISVPHFFGRRYSTYPQSPAATSVNHWAADYITFLGGAPCLNTTFNGVDTGTFGLYTAQMGTLPTVVQQQALNATNDGSWSWPGFSTWADSVVLVVEDLHSGAPIDTYSYTASINATGGVAGIASAGPSLEVSPNPSRGEIRLAARAGAGAGAAKISLFTAEGRELAQLPLPTSGEGDVSWDGRDRAGNEMPAGVYWARLSGGTQPVTRKVVITR